MRYLTMMLLILGCSNEIPQSIDHINLEIQGKKCFEELNRYYQFSYMNVSWCFDYGYQYYE